MLFMLILHIGVLNGSRYAFLPKNDAAQQLHERLLALGLKSVCVNGHMGLGERYAYAESFGREPTVVCSAFVVLENQSAPMAEAAYVCLQLLSSCFTSLAPIFLRENT